MITNTNNIQSGTIGNQKSADSCARALEFAPARVCVRDRSFDFVRHLTRVRVRSHRIEFVLVRASVRRSLCPTIIENSSFYEFYYRYKHLSTEMNHIYDQKVDEKSERKL